ncbi:brain acid soluble protein 1-like [Acanthaster planci]|uniref:Brain acid soluble protein 1-like n=1 Tax=Acanthaster planci TaxID=133434 RepID=A0A8B7XXU8_ACAPL|nr:brain acid soluble protein 1-like [Acanthaster planci]XP_022085703.1 brain acid soluble protein 1-like [Acanthaster planci]XP_022085713.1 brain acid soluble protein 1-like [Acanthaster planci]XP_022085723.1 brain acid soluble protein 1-like [Acanthaster planci]
MSAYNVPCLAVPAEKVCRDIECSSPPPPLPAPPPKCMVECPSWLWYLFLLLVPVVIASVCAILYRRRRRPGKSDDVGSGSCARYPPVAQSKSKKYSFNFLASRPKSKGKPDEERVAGEDPHRETNARASQEQSGPSGATATTSSPQRSSHTTENERKRSGSKTGKVSPEGEVTSRPASATNNARVRSQPQGPSENGAKASNMKQGAAETPKLKKVPNEKRELNNASRKAPAASNVKPSEAKPPDLKKVPDEKRELNNSSRKAPAASNVKPSEANPPDLKKVPDEKREWNNSSRKAPAAKK